MKVAHMITLYVAICLVSCQTNSSRTTTNSDGIDVEEACRLTRYPNLCVHSLSSFSSSGGKRSLTMWARAGVSVTIAETKNLTHFLTKLKTSNLMRGRKDQLALSDCIECFDNAIDELHRSLGLLRLLTSKRAFEGQIEDLVTWISAAMTDEDTCLDGFEGEKRRQVKLIQDRVMDVSFVTSNALALVNNLAANGLLIRD